MKDIYRNKTFYFVVGAVVLALWPLLMGAVYLPRAEKAFDNEREQYRKAEKTIMQILEVDPDRLDYKETAAGEEFDYASAVEKVASSHNITANKYKFSSGMIIKSGGRKTQSAKIVLDDVSILQIAKFLSTMETRWSDLECSSVKLTKSKATPDGWKADLDFKYYLSD